MTTVMTLDIATEIENAEIDMLSSRLERLQTISGNPMQVQIKKFGSATAFSSKIIAGPAFNTVKVLQMQMRLMQSFLIMNHYKSLSF